MRQKGFATLEVILMVMVIGILASIAVPRFTSVTTAANTAKIQSDLSTIDTAISIYYMEHGSYPTALNQLKDYIRGVENDTSPDLKPPTGSAYISGTETKITATAYQITTPTGTEEARAYLQAAANTSEKFYIPKKTS